ncbi:MAG TPA: lytic transglycosylase domain-containing protein [Terriglobia bacterium]|nr:lytic transglycosylase domain-containing protein [Terriglobia bacterium]
MPNLKLVGSTMGCGPKHWIVARKSSILMGLAWGLSMSGDVLAFGTGSPQSRKKQPDLIHAELKVLVDEFGSDANRIPADFLQKVRRWARLYQTRDRSDMAKVLESQRELFDSLKQQVQEAALPPDLAFITLVESEFKPKVRSRTNNVGLWQLEPITARLHGLKVNSKVDERLDPKKSTAAACRYISSLRRTLGPDTSLLVTVAAYNLGPSRLQSRMKTVKDPDRQRDFWHLYSTRRIPALTRTHIARLMAAIIVGRNERHFGFGRINNSAAGKANAHNPNQLPAPDREATLLLGSKLPARYP